LSRQELRIPGGDPGIELFVLEVPRAPKSPRRGAVVFVHGAGSGGSAIWDLQTRDYSMMRTLACEGFDTYAFDARGFGGSSLPKEMESAPELHPPLVRAAEAARDLAKIVEHAQKRSKVEQVDLVAWSWGSDVSGLYAGENADEVRRLVLYAPVYDRRWPERHKSSGAYRIEEKEKALSYFDATREEEDVYREHIELMFRFSKGPSLKLPNGPYRDIYGPEAPIWTAAKIRAEVLIIRGSEDRASLEEAVQHLLRDLTGAPERRYVLISGGHHFLMRERRYPQFQRVVTEFLTAPKLLVKD
jgi:pimeloyl-ACP methyl ester carboxylesterase